MPIALRNRLLGKFKTAAKDLKVTNGLQLTQAFKQDRVLSHFLNTK